MNEYSITVNLPNNMEEQLEYTAYFVWVNVNGIPYPQKWLYEPTHNATGKTKDDNVLKKIKLSDMEAGMMIDELKQKYSLE